VNVLKYRKLPKDGLRKFFDSQKSYLEYLRAEKRLVEEEEINRKQNKMSLIEIILLLMR